MFCASSTNLVKGREDKNWRRHSCAYVTTLKGFVQHRVQDAEVVIPQSELRERIHTKDYLHGKRCNVSVITEKVSRLTLGGAMVVVVVEEIGEKLTNHLF